MDKCRSLGLRVDLYRRYVDDMLLVLRAVGKGWYYNKSKGVLEYSHQQYLRDRLLTPTEKTALVMADIENAIHNKIQVTTESPEMNADG